MYSMPQKPTKPVPPAGKNPTGKRPMKPPYTTGGPMPKPPGQGSGPMKPIKNKNVQTVEGQKVKAMQQYMAQKKGKSY